MERFVIGAAVAVAVLIAIGGYFGRGVSDEHGFRFEIDGAEPGGAVAGSGVPATMAATRYAATELKVREAVAILKVIPEDRTDISLEIANPGKVAMPRVRVDGDALIVDGGIRNIGRCSHTATQINGGPEVERFEVTARGVGALDTADMPVITARVPRDVELSVGGAVDTHVAAAASANISLSGCGKSKIEDVAGLLDLSTAGSGEVITGAAGKATVSAAGSGATTLGAVTDGLEVSLAGAGDVTAASAGGPLDISIAGSGDLAVNGGKMSDADVSIAGSGSVRVVGDVANLDASVIGSGDVIVRGAAASVDANIIGSGDVQVVSVTGAVQKSVVGAGSVRVGPIPPEE